MTGWLRTFYFLLRNGPLFHRFTNVLELIPPGFRTAVGGTLLRQYGVTAKNVRKEVQKQESWEESITIGTLPLSKHANSLVESATKYAIENKHSSVGTGGFLLAMIINFRISLNALVSDSRQILIG
jgi:hypothetical protein